MKSSNHNVIRCEKCGEVLKPKNIKWLELSITDGNYYTELPKGHESQGAFPFGTTCATSQIKETIQELKRTLDRM
jgi:hypothetical protein